MVPGVVTAIFAAGLLWHALIIAFVWWYKPAKRRRKRADTPEERILKPETYRKEFGDD
jgi:hypothetical protein